jgi:hypothetical protein
LGVSKGASFRSDQQADTESVGQNPSGKPHNTMPSFDGLLRQVLHFNVMLMVFPVLLLYEAAVLEKTLLSVIETQLTVIYLM